MDINFTSLKELKERVTPALETKQKEFKKTYMYDVSIEEMWNYLKTQKWKSSENLTLYDIVNDILKLTQDELEEYERSITNEQN